MLSYNTSLTMRRVVAAVKFSSAANRSGKGIAGSKCASE